VLTFCRYLLEHGANVSAVNNDGELAIDISESDEMEELLQSEIDSRGVDAAESRRAEERLMLEDAKRWAEEAKKKLGGDTNAANGKPHPKTGATPLHVAAAKGYGPVLRWGSESNGLLANVFSPFDIFQLVIARRRAGKRAGLGRLDSVARGRPLGPARGVPGAGGKLRQHGCQELRGADVLRRGRPRRAQAVGGPQAEAGLSAEGSARAE